MAQHRTSLKILIAGIGLSCITPEVRGSDNARETTPAVHIGDNFRIYPSAVSQTETFITRHPTDPSVLFVSANTINLDSGFLSEGIYVSTDAGSSWRGSDTCNGPPITFHGGDPGIAIDKNGTFILIRLSSVLAGLYSHYSTDNGLSWSTQKTIVLNDQDRATLITDGIATSSFYGRSYAAWVQFAFPYPVFFAYTDDGATTWSTPEQLNNPPQRCQGGDLAIGPGGSVNLCWAGVLSQSPFTEDYAGFASSTDGATTWSIIEQAFDMNGIFGTLTEKGNIRVNGLPRIDVDKTGGLRNGWIYVVTGERSIQPAGTDPDILFHRSTDAGLTWSAGIRVNQDVLDNGKVQYFPAVHVDEGGGVNVLYYDDRNTTPDSSGVFLSRSTDGGSTWNDYEVSDHNFRPTPIAGGGQGYQGDNIGLNSIGDTLWPVWMDNSSGIYQIWSCPIDISDLGTSVREDPEPDDLTLKQNYPNPFNPATVIEFTLPRQANVTVQVFDVLGRRVAEPVRGSLLAGYHAVFFDGTGLPSGVYVCRLTTGESVRIRKMIMLR